MPGYSTSFSGIEIVNDNRDKFKSELEKAIHTALDEIGAKAESYAKSVVPVDTGRLRDSITHKVNDADSSVEVGSDVHYASYVELGTSRMRAQPYLRPSIERHSSEYKSILEQRLSNS